MWLAPYGCTPARCCKFAIAKQSRRRHPRIEKEKRGETIPDLPLRPLFLRIIVIRFAVACVERWRFAANGQM